MPQRSLREALDFASLSIARRDAQTLLLHVLGKDRAWLFAHSEITLTDGEAAAFQALVQRRDAHEPLQYLTGRQEFYGLDLHVTPATLIPRPETELLVEAVVLWCRGEGKQQHIVDVGTGTGAIALACASQLPEASILACDISEAALDVARSNAGRPSLGLGLGLANRITFLCSDLLSTLPAGHMFDVVVSNPPYVPRGDAATMQPEVVDHEPHLALFAGDDGLDVYRRLIPQAHAALRGGGLLALEIGYGQRDALQALLMHGWQKVRFLDDYAGIARVALAERDGASVSSGA